MDERMIGLHHARAAIDAGLNVGDVLADVERHGPRFIRVELVERDPEGQIVVEGDHVATRSIIVPIDSKHPWFDQAPEES